MRTEAGRILIAERIIGNDKIDDYGEVLRYNVFHAELVIRHAEDRKVRKMENAINLNEINIDSKPPEDEPAREYYFMAKCRRYVKAESERLGRPLTAAVITFGCQMNTEHEIEKAA